MRSKTIGAEPVSRGCDGRRRHDQGALRGARSACPRSTRRIGCVSRARASRRSAARAATASSNSTPTDERHAALVRLRSAGVGQGRGGRRTHARRRGEGRVASNCSNRSDGRPPASPCKHGGSWLATPPRTLQEDSHEAGAVRLSARHDDAATRSMRSRKPARTRACSRAASR